MEGAKKRAQHGDAQRPLSSGERELLVGRRLTALDAGGNLIRTAYAQLSGERHLGFGAAGPIPWSKVVEWCKLNGVSSPRARDRVIRVIALVDADFARRRAAKGA